MAEFQVAFAEDSKTVKVLPADADTPEDMEMIGTFTFDEDENTRNHLTKVLYHEVRELLAKQGVQDMSKVSIHVTQEAYDQVNGEPVSEAVEAGIIEPPNGAMDPVDPEEVQKQLEEAKKNSEAEADIVDTDAGVTTRKKTRKKAEEKEKSEG